MSRLSRRQFLAAMGLGAGSLWLPSLRTSVAGGPPKRLIIFYTMQGVVPWRWQMRGERALDQDWNYYLPATQEEEWSEILRPLYGVREHLTILDGLSLPTALAEPNTADPHAVGHVHTMTAAPIVPVGAAAAISSAPSVDQIIAAGVRRADRLPSLEYAVGPLGAHRAFFNAARSPLPAEHEPLLAYNRLFGVRDEDPVSAAQEDLLALVASEYARTASSMSREDRQKLEQHRDLVSDLQARVRWTADDSCQAPDLGALDPELFERWEARNYEPAYDAFRHLLASALSCDLTRVVTLNMGDLPHHICAAPAGDIHGDFAHSIYTSEQSAEVMTRYGAAHAAQFAQLVELLAQIPEGNGTLLDSTAVLWAHDVGDGAHDYESYPLVLAGSCGGAFETGRYRYYAPDTPNPSPLENAPPLLGPPHSHFLVSLCQAMGLELDQVGLESVVANDGSTIDLRGPLRGLG